MTLSDDLPVPSNRSPLINEQGIMTWLVALLMPVAVVMAAVRLLLTPVYLVIEYNTPGFPADRYGFTKTDRLYWSKIAVEYLLNDQGISFLADLRFPNGEQTPPETCRFMDDCNLVYNERELKHMLDVKFVVKAALDVWYASLGILLVLWILAARFRWGNAYRAGMRRGGLLTVILLGGIILFVLLAFGFIFVAFHKVFFESGTWQFLFSDTLIRLFPERLWRDTFLAVGLLAGGAGLAIWTFLRNKTSPVS
jgi:integral membrane protein (TIGR01906 family)